MIEVLAIIDRMVILLIMCAIYYCNYDFIIYKFCFDTYKCNCFARLFVNHNNSIFFLLIAITASLNATALIAI